METFTISNGVLSARIADYGSTLVDLRLKDWPHPLVLGFESEADYVDANHYSGAVIGRFANRIGGGRAMIDGQPVQLSVNSDGNHLHGGAAGLARQYWTATEETSDSVSFTVTSPEGCEGYPGNCVFTVTYSVIPPAILQLDFEAVTDAPTLVNMCHHPYFNFAGSGEIGRHQLEIRADRFLWSGNGLLPNGEIRTVAGTPYDFTAQQFLNGPRPDPGYNNTYCLGSATRAKPALAARLSLEDGPAMELWTTQPGLHLYDAYKLPREMRGLEGRIYGPHQAICLEAQGWPDSPNHAHFPSALLRPGETYRQTTQYRFELGSGAGAMTDRMAAGKT